MNICKVDFHKGHPPFIISVGWLMVQNAVKLCMVRLSIHI